MDLREFMSHFLVSHNWGKRNKLMNKLFTLQVFYKSSFSAETEIGFRSKPSLFTLVFLSCIHFLR